MAKEKIILGIDPGTTLMGYGVLQVTNGNPHMVTLGVISLKSMADHFTKLQYVFTRVTGLVKEYLPDELAIEAPFYGKNVQSMLKLGRAQGVAIAAALAYNIPVFEYAPRKIKMAITGQGSASKEQVAAILKNILKLKEIPDNLDATDGLAAALCHHYQAGLPNIEKGYRSWKDFINKNPGKLNK
ncbi:MAG: crossover junction endodeoxyribonuclease RuvC [Bacteroidota bacterium]